MVPGQVQKVALGGGGGRQTETVCTRVVQQRGQAVSAMRQQRLGKPTGMAGPTRMQQARDSVLRNASSGLLEEGRKAG